MSRALALPLSLIVVLAAGPAVGAAFGAKPKKRFAPPPAADVGLRGPLGAAAGSSPTLAPLTAAGPSLTVPTLGLSAPGVGLAGLSTGGFSASRPITPLPQVGDPAPICRAECAKVRIVCASSDDLGCDTRWVQCVADCSAPTFR